MESERVKLRAFLVQLFATISIAYLTSLTGYIYAWPSYTLENFMSNQTILMKPLNSMEVSLLGSLTNVGGLLATPFCGVAIDTLGRKYSAILFGLPHLVAWLIISLTTSVPLILAGVGIAGIGAAGQAVSSIYISEICQDSIRGALTSSTVSGFFLGLLTSYTLGGYLTYYQVVYTHLSLSVLYVIILSTLKESPVFLVQKGKEKEAAQSIAFYRQVDVNSKEVENAIRKIKLQLDPRIDQIVQLGNDPNVSEKLLTEKLSESEDQKPVSAFRFFMKSESTKRAMFTVVMIMALTIMMGAIVLQVYAEPLFKEAVPTMPPNLCSIFLAIDFLVAALLCSFVVDKYGRKFLMTVTAAGSGILTLLLGTQLHFYWAPHWTTAVFIYSYCFVYNLGAATVPFILTAEVFLPEVRGLCSSISMACMWIMNFVTLMIFNPLVELFGLGPLFYLFSAVCFIGSIFSHFCLPETKGLSADAIQPLFLKNHKRNIST